MAILPVRLRALAIAALPALLAWLATGVVPTEDPTDVARSFWNAWARSDTTMMRRLSTGLVALAYIEVMAEQLRRAGDALEEVREDTTKRRS